MHTYSLSNKAKDDLIHIGKFTEKRWNKSQRNSYLKKIDLTFQLLCRDPFAGMSCGYIRTAYRKFPIESHIVYYRESPRNNILIVRILHKHMDVGRAKF